MATSSHPSKSAISRGLRVIFTADLLLPIASSHLFDRPLDQLPVLLVVERLPNYFLGGNDDEVGNLGPHGSDRLVALRLDLLAGVLDCALGLLVRLLLELLSQLLGRLRRAI